MKLARLARSGDLTPVWVPGPKQEAMRDLARACDDMKSQEGKARLAELGMLMSHSFQE